MSFRSGFIRGSGSEFLDRPVSVQTRTNPFVHHHDTRELTDTRDLHLEVACLYPLLRLNFS